MLIGVVGVATVGGACKRFRGGGDAGTPPAPSARVAPGAWSTVMKDIPESGEVPVGTALRAYALAFGALPGVDAPQPDATVPFCGTTPAMWVEAHRATLTPQQRAAVDAAWEGKARAAPTNAIRIADDVARPYEAEITSAAAWVEQFLGLERPLEVAVHAASLGSVVPLSGTGTAAAAARPECAADTTPLSSCTCRIRLDPRALEQVRDRPSERREIFVHELVHCAQYTRFAGKRATFGRNAGLAWVVEGFASWVQSKSVPNPNYSSWLWMEMLAGDVMVGGQIPGRFTLQTFPYSGGLSLLGLFERAGVPLADVKRRGLDLVRQPTPAAALAEIDAWKPGAIKDWASEPVRKPPVGPGWDITPPAAWSDYRRKPGDAGVVTASSFVTVKAPVGSQQVSQIAFGPDVESIDVIVTGAGRLAFAKATGDGPPVVSGIRLDWDRTKAARYCVARSPGDACASAPMVPRENGIVVALAGGAGGASAIVLPAPRNEVIDPCLVGRWRYDDTAASANAQRRVAPGSLAISSMTIDLTMDVALDGRVTNNLRSGRIQGQTPGGAIRTNLSGTQTGRFVVARRGNLVAQLDADNYQASSEVQIMGRWMPVPMTKDQAVGIGSALAGRAPQAGGSQRATYRCGAGGLQIDPDEGDPSRWTKVTP